MASAKYEHEMDKPKVAPMGSKIENCVSCMDFKKQADSIAYGQAGEAGVKSDMSKIHSQFKSYVDDSNSGY